MNIERWVNEAHARIVQHIRKTPLEYSPYLSELTGAKVWLKLENYQVTGSFKVRGALNKLLSLTKDRLRQGVIAASTGNHAAGVAYASEIAKTKARIYMPDTVSEAKKANLEAYNNVELVIGGPDCVDAELEAIDVSSNSGVTYVSPYNDEVIIGGQGTIGLEILADLPSVDTVLVPVGGGGLISGIAGYLKSKSPEIRVVGCQPENSAVMYHSIRAGKVLDMESLPTISDGTAGGMEEDSITFEICRHYVDDFHLVSEAEIVDALKIILAHHYMLVEGAAALAAASLIKNKSLYANKNVVLILCGNKLSESYLKQILK